MGGGVINVQLANVPPHDLSQCTWDQIKAASRSKTAEQWWPLGSLSPLIHVEGTAEETALEFKMRARVLGFNHNAEVEGDGTILFWFDQDEEGNPIAVDADSYGASVEANGAGFCMNRKGQIGLDDPDATLSQSERSAGSIRGGWEHCYGRLHSCRELFNCLPSDLQQAIAISRIYSDNAGSLEDLAASMTMTEDLLYYPSMVELYGGHCGANLFSDALQQQADWFKAGNSVAAGRLSDTSVDCFFFSRDPQPYNNEYTKWTGVLHGVPGAGRPSLSGGARPFFKV